MENKQSTFREKINCANPIILKVLEAGGRVVFSYDEERGLIIKIISNSEVVKKLDEVLKDCQTEIK